MIDVVVICSGMVFLGYVNFLTFALISLTSVLFRDFDEDFQFDNSAYFLLFEVVS